MVKTLVYILGFILLLVFIGSLLGDDKVTSHNKEIANSFKETPPETDKRPLEVILSDNINDLEKNIKPKLFEPTEIDMTAFYNHISDFVTTIKIADTSKTLEIQKLRAKLETSLRSYQSSKLKELRKTYSDNAKNRLWEEDINVKLSSDTKTLTLTGYIFASNKRKKEVYVGIHTILEMLRFKRLIMRFTDYSEYTYYDISPPKDSDLKGIDFTF